jgi:hypothetical protein
MRHAPLQFRDTEVEVIVAGLREALRATGLDELDESSGPPSDSA